MPGCEPLVGEYAVGTLGEADISNATIKSSSGDWKFPKVAAGSKANNAYQVEHDDFFDAIKNNLPYNEAETGAMATMTAILGRLTPIFFAGFEHFTSEDLTPCIDNKG